MLKNDRLLTCPTLVTTSPSCPGSAKAASSPRDAPFPKQGRNFAADPHFTFHASRFDKLTVPSRVEGRFTVGESDAGTMLADLFSILRDKCRRQKGGEAIPKEAEEPIVLSVLKWYATPSRMLKALYTAAVIPAEAGI